MNLELTDKVALVTGSSRGIGAGVALHLASEGCHLVLTGRDAAALEGTAAKIHGMGRRASVCAVDLCKPSAAAELITRASADFGRLDILVNNAGMTKRGDFLEFTDEDWVDGFGLKFFAHVRLSRAAWPLLKAANGSVVMIGGTSGRKPYHGFAIGSSVNAACAAFGKALADLGKRDGVQVNTIHPGHIDTDRLTRRLTAEVDNTGKSMQQVRADYCKSMGIDRFGTVEDVSNLIVFIVSKRAPWLIGTTIDLDGGEIPVL